MNEADWPPPAVEVCCGRGSPTWAGKPFVVGCQVCSSSPTWWQRTRSEPYVAQPLRFEADPVALAARLAEIADDPNWPRPLRAEAQASIGASLEVDDLADSTLDRALNARIRARANQPAKADSQAAVRGRLAP